MPGPYGSLANPVELDPFQQIVNVHWVSPYIAAQLDIELTTIFEVQLGPGHGPPYVEPFTFYSTTLATYSFPTGGAVNGFFRFSGGDWDTLPTDTGEVTVSGEPTLPGPYTYPLWQWQGIDGAGLKAPFLVFTSGDEGGPLVPFVPGHPSQHFTDGLAGNLLMRAQGFAPGGPYSDPGGNETHEMWATGQSSGAGVGIPIIQDAETASISVAGMTLVFDEKTYAAIGSKVIAAGGTYGSGEFWVLFKRQVTP